MDLINVSLTWLLLVMLSTDLSVAGSRALQYNSISCEQNFFLYRIWEQNNLYRIWEQNYLYRTLIWHTFKWMSLKSVCVCVCVCVCAHVWAYMFCVFADRVSKPAHTCSPRVGVHKRTCVWLAVPCVRAAGEFLSMTPAPTTKALCVSPAALHARLLLSAVGPGHRLNASDMLMLP